MNTAKELTVCVGNADSDGNTEASVVGRIDAEGLSLLVPVGKLDTDGDADGRSDGFLVG